MSRYIDIDALMEDIESLYRDEEDRTDYNVAIADALVVIDEQPTADVVERKEFILDGGKCSCHFAEIDGHKNIVFTLYNAVTDITNIRIRLDKYNLAEVVMCKDCIHCEHWYADKGRCFLWHEGGIDVFEDGFCNYGERREDDKG